jgi:hypothetical protein
MLNEGAEQAIAMLDEYGMSREDYFETLQELQLGGVHILIMHILIMAYSPCFFVRL